MDCAADNRTFPWDGAPRCLIRDRDAERKSRSVFSPTTLPQGVCQAAFVLEAHWPVRKATGPFLGGKYQHFAACYIVAELTKGEVFGTHSQ